MEVSAQDFLIAVQLSSIPAECLSQADRTGGEDIIQRTGHEYACQAAPALICFRQEEHIPDLNNSDAPDFFDL